MFILGGIILDEEISERLSQQILVGIILVGRLDWDPENDEERSERVTWDV